MAYQKYNGYQYETSPRKLQPEYEPKKKITKNKTNKNKEKNKKNKASAKQVLESKIKIACYVFIGFAILFAISYRNSQITIAFNQKESLKKELGVIQKENEQLEVNIENSLNLSNIEQLAKEKLGMQKLNNNQKVYVSLDKKDYIEPATEEVIIDNNTSIWSKIVKLINSLIK